MAKGLRMLASDQKAQDSLLNTGESISQWDPRFRTAAPPRRARGERHERAFKKSNSTASRAFLNIAQSTPHTMLRGSHELLKTCRLHNSVFLRPFVERLSTDTSERQQFSG
ncbi:hypothetical protein EVAR_85245_1 [Eumeta japonica]|uniref:Uncharacterized protein n=1 Tax=Eumeta variegata TaxID=151549 RepID=A0A4C1VZ39_EUMVA|nr:hypothetical protein EVAR_85245_1 [Eumeta japonica]